jgi:hypothetical protein
VLKDSLAAKRAKRGWRRLTIGLTPLAECSPKEGPPDYSSGLPAHHSGPILTLARTHPS